MFMFMFFEIGLMFIMFMFMFFEIGLMFMILSCLCSCSLKSVMLMFFENKKSEQTDLRTEIIGDAGSKGTKRA